MSGAPLPVTAEPELVERELVAAIATLTLPVPGETASEVAERNGYIQALAQQLQELLGPGSPPLPPAYCGPDQTVFLLLGEQVQIYGSDGGECQVSLAAVRGFLGSVESGVNGHPQQSKSPERGAD